MGFNKVKIVDYGYKLAVFISSLFFIVYIFQINLSYPYLGTNIEKTSKGQYYIRNIDPKAWADRAGLKIGDQVLELNGVPTEKFFRESSFFVYQEVKNLTIKRADGSIFKINVEETSLDFQTFFMMIIPIILFLLSMYCSFFVYRSSKKLKILSPYLLKFFLLCVSLAYLFATSSARGDIFSQYMVVLFFTLTPVIYLHFLYHYFYEHGQELFNKKVIIFGYFLVIVNFLIEYINKQPIDLDINYNSKVLNLITFLFLLLISFIVKVKGMRKLKLSEISFTIRNLIITNVLAFAPFVLLYVIPYIILKDALFSPVFLSSFMLLIPFALVYQFLSSKIYDIEFILGRVKYYALLSILPTIFLVAFIILLKEHNPKIYPIQLSIIIYILMIFVFYFKEIVDFRFRFKRFSEKYNYQDSILKYTSRIRKAGSLKQMMAELKSTILEVLKVSRAYCLVVHESGRIEMVDDDGDGGLLEIAPYEKDILNAVTEIGKIVEFDKGFVLTVGETNRRKYVIICLSVIKTPKLTRDEISWLNSLAFYTNVTVENFLKIEELMERLEKAEEGNSNPAWLKKLLFAIEEKQRSNLAKDLHDSVLQDLISLKRQCELVLEESGQYPAATIEKIQSMNQNILDIIHMTRETCQELRPQILYDLGLVKAVSKLVAQYEEQCNFQIRFNTGNFNKQLDINMQLNLYRIIQELLSNARKHSNAKQILIMLVNIREKIVLHYEDDGVGIDEELLYAKTESMGLSGIRERVKALDGEMKIETSPGNGFRVLIEI
ncbi:ATP-binding protein [Aeribacillus composti]|uniref:ATP-binding protein n=1 Tax=Aeribacillus composti TaxID=1868734 RepID=UPI00406A42F0